jgi:pimeloyl-ACP methyl ester carboxylesterase
MPLDYQLYQNFIDHKESLTIKSALKKLKAAHLIVHGKLDDVVLPIEASNLHKWSSSSELLMLDGINHALGNNQPWKSSKMPNELEFIVNKTIEFLNK